MVAVKYGEDFTPLKDTSTLADILSPEDLNFHIFVNQHIEEYLPQSLIQVWKYNLDDKPLNGLVLDEDTFKQKDVDVYGSTLGDNNQILKRLAHFEKAPTDIQLTSEKPYQYVGQYFRIDNDTIGVMFVPSITYQLDTKEALKQLLLLVADDYLSPHEAYSNDVVRYQVISDVCGAGLLSMYINLFKPTPR